MKEECRIGLVQVETHANKKETLAACAEQMLQLAAQGANIICLPEFLNIPGDPSFDNTIDRYAWAETLDGPTVSMARDIATNEGVTVIAPIYENDGGFFFNSAVVLDPSGEVQGIYRKTSLGTPEQAYYLPGNLGFPVFSDSRTGWRFGILICYDRHFPEAMRVLALKGADVVFVPTASARGVWTDPIWETELRYHALNNRFFHAAVNRVGLDPGFRNSKQSFPPLTIDVHI
jgi:beta-ureidopropionase